ncbi:uncharacterized protein LOC128734042 [Sabethes cyaneus]|uniref:uncharacterized protein LOC128734042 n=1 Tax=Sabethes cyaneus TaxID=53552 RepID=UPI00237E4393|nr:uncharacterized protein LOC128734042 [Sabethes cyaneus]XP_053683994.1 uncharacterized protein LOC128734042 [Sabethes cyaneus]XP_053683996.1 uncharacterized protein LOC128734042 [Sabethes cyaneus]
MKSLFIFATVMVAGAFALQDGQVCEPGSNFMVDCNVCRCSTDGKLMSCTRKFCVPEEQGDDPKAQPTVASAGDTGEKEEEHLQTNGQVCTPNEVKMEDCNRCKCAANGIGWFCTRKACKPREKRDVSVQRSTQSCTPGTSFKSTDGCNDCFCTETGIAACTMKFCFPKVKRAVSVRRKRAVEKKCVPGSSFKSADGCNDCFCTETGVAACTLRFCFSNIDQGISNRQKRDVEKKCVPGSSFKSADGCNDCFCTETGIAACTLRFCIPASKQDVSARRKRDVGNMCVPGTSFKSEDGCNDCFCTKNGEAACTEKLCLPSKFKRSNDEIPRSLIPPWSPDFSCAPSSNFKYQCNMCRCDNTGKSAACTYRACIPGEY